MPKHITNGIDLGSAKEGSKKKQKSSPLVTVMKEWSPKSKSQPKLEVQSIVEYSGINEAFGGALRGKPKQNGPFDVNDPENQAPSDLVPMIPAHQRSSDLDHSFLRDWNSKS